MEKLFEVEKAMVSAKIVKHYTIISGTGRAGTTLLVRILGKAGLNIGFDPAALSVDPVAHAGLELDVREKPSCYIVKSPWMATYIDQVLPRDDIAIDHAIICIRGLYEAAESRRRIQLISGVAEPNGGLWETSIPEKQEVVLAELFYRLIFHLTEHDVPLTFLHFPRFARDPAYFVKKMSGIFGGIDPGRLESALLSEVQPELITDFSRHEGGS
jgi:hypothetical protein